MRFNKSLLILILIIILIINILLLFTYSYLLQDSEEIDVYVTVGDYIGVNVDSSKLYFGTIPPGNYGFRKIHISNNKCDLCIVNIRSKGDTAKWLKVSQNNFKIKDNEVKDIEVLLEIPKDTKNGNYTGKLIIYFWKTI